MSNIPVVIGAETVATNADGEFTVNDVDATYDCTVIVSDRKLAFHYVDLSRRDPTFQLYRTYDDSVEPYSTDVTVDLTVGGLPATPEETRMVLDVDRLDADLAMSQIANISAYWRGTSQVDAMLYGIAFDSARTMFGYGQQAVTLTDAVSSNETLDLTVVGASARTATITAPSGYVPDIAYAGLRFSDRAFVDIRTDNTAGEEFTFSFPDLPDHTMFVVSRAVATTTTGTTVNRAVAQVTADTNTLTLAHRIAAAPLIPVDGATGVSLDTTFQYTESEGAIYVVQVVPQTADAPTYVIVTGRASVTIPDLGGVGLELPPGVDYDWSVQTVGPYADVDAATGDKGYASVVQYLLYGRLDSGLPNSATLGLGGSRSFTVAP